MRLDPDGGRLRLERTIRTRTSVGVLEVADVTMNLGPVTEPAPLLYHVNVGVPMFDQGARLEMDSEEVAPRDADAEGGLSSWMTPGPPRAGAREMVFEHRLRPDPSGWDRAALVNPAVHLWLVLQWRRAELPRFHQWLHPGASVYVLGLEPANCSVLGRAADRAAGTLPVLEPGARRATELRITVQRLDEER